MNANQILNPDLDMAPLASRLRERGAVRVDHFLNRDIALRLQTCLRDEVPWTLAYRAGDQSRTVDHATYAGMDEKAVAELHASVHQAAGEGFGFLYDSYMMIPAYLEQRNPHLLLHPMVEILNSPAMLGHLLQITGDAAVTKLDAQATRYRPGHFLRFHNDLQESEGRRFAFVLNLTARWQADWGGLLQLLDGPEQVLETLTPRFNSLSLFRVPTDHCVSMVAPFAQEPRLAITGWLRA